MPVWAFSSLIDCAASFALISSLEPSNTRMARPIPPRLQIQLQHDLRHHGFPNLAAKAVPVLRLGTFTVPVDDGHDHRSSAAHPGGNLITVGQPSYDRAVLKLAPIVVICRLIHSSLSGGEANKC